MESPLPRELEPADREHGCCTYDRTTIRATIRAQPGKWHGALGRAGSRYDGVVSYGPAAAHARSEPPPVRLLHDQVAVSR
jgi:hypothetical protein